MFLDYFYALKQAKIPVSVREYLTLLEAFDENLLGPEGSGQALQQFYTLSRMILVKDEKYFDKFDLVFAEYFRGVESFFINEQEIPEDWLRKTLEKSLTEDEKAAIPKLEWDELMRKLQERLAEQKDRHAGGSKWIGTGGTSPFGHGGYNPQGIRIGGSSKNKSAVKVWDQRIYKDYDDEQQLGIRNLKVALRRLRRFARESIHLELDLPGTIHKTAANAGYLDLSMIPERNNQVKVLLLLDVGGTMDEHIERVEELFSASKSEFKHLEFYYFHNCVYDFVWKNNVRRFAEKFSTYDIIRKYNQDYRLIFVGDATMSPYEILQPGGSVEYNNSEPGATWLQRLTQHYAHYVWINPEPKGVWEYRQSIALIKNLMADRMYPLTIQGLEQAMKLLSK